MGLFSSIKKIALPALGAAGGFMIGGPAGAAAGLALGGSLSAGMEQSSAASAAERKGRELAASQQNALQALQNAQTAANDARRMADIADVKAHISGEQARLDERQGIDFSSLVDDAQAAGFNPLTALLATGGAAYDKAATFLQTPFFSRDGVDYSAQMQGVMSSSAALTELARDKAATAGYFGQAVANFGTQMIGVSQEHARLKQDMQIADMVDRRAGQALAIDARPAQQYVSPLEALRMKHPFIEINPAEEWRVLEDGSISTKLRFSKDWDEYVAGNILDGLSFSRDALTGGSTPGFIPTIPAEKTGTGVGGIPGSIRW